MGPGEGDLPGAANDFMPTVDYPRLVRLCAYLSGEGGAAEDLAQDALLEAWRQRHKLQDLAGSEAWLAAIARNVCLRWGRARGRDEKRYVPLLQDGPASVESSLAGLGAMGDLDAELEQVERAALIDQALTRAVR